MKKTAEYVYHYHAFWQMNDLNLCHNDGIVTMSGLIMTWDDYSSLQDEIMKQMVPRPPKKTKIVIDSLSFLGMR